MKKIILIGGGGHCKVVIEAILLAKVYKIAGILDLKEKMGEKVLNVPIIGSDKDLEGYYKNGIKNCFITVGSVGKPDLRVKLFHLADNIGFDIPNILHPNSMISRSAKLGRGNYISAGVIINSGVVIGDNCIINTGTIIEHDCCIGDFVHVAPGVTMSGGVTVGRYSHIGTGSSIAQYLKIGSNTIIGSGSVVVKDVKDNIVAYGKHCRVVRANAKKSICHS